MGWAETTRCHHPSPPRNDSAMAIMAVAALFHARFPLIARRTFPSSVSYCPRTLLSNEFSYRLQSIIRFSSSDKDSDTIVPEVQGPNFLKYSDEELMKQCKFETFRVSGPGGQHRNKRDSAVRLKHLPTGIVAQAVEDRSQHKNRASALNRLRTLLAIKGLNSDPFSHDFKLKVHNLLVSSVRNKVDIEAYSPPPELLQILPPNLSTGGLSRLILSHDGLRMAVNSMRAAKGMKPLK
ncbi:hypothetical protein IGI04_035682 [Brassica rapa subsp. trilocularis]|uniref:Prokaryotic-type class I peptide chain release factors domain-containing protein n=1 Tax=Brassica rapa subsp. trilocularis TaxID=1813537 RepID=A0ABQ7LCB8_BRACM|nr:hypothetical protein IGI04_035682 [Brassica rapa subsp. trilocularis]